MERESNMVDEHRIGIIEINNDLIKRDPNLILEVLEGILIIASNYDNKRKSILYTAYCEQFDPLLASEDYPLYSIRIKICKKTGMVIRKTIERLRPYDRGNYWNNGAKSPIIEYESVKPVIEDERVKEV